MSKALTVRTLESMKPGKTRREIPDGFIGGLYFVLQPSGSASWAVRYRTPQRVARKLTLGQYPAIGLKDARELASRALTAVAEGQDPALAKQAAKSAQPAPPELDLVEKVVDSFIERYAKPNTRPTTAHEAERVLKREIVGRWKGRRLSSIIRAEVHALLDEMVDRGSPIQANRLLAVFRKMCGWAVERGLIEHSPCERVKAPSAERSRDRILSDVELRGIWAACDALGYPFGPLTKLLILTGQRREEVGAMTWAEIDIRAKLWTIPRRRAKNNVEHTVPLSPQAIAIIEKLPRIGGQFLFSTNTKNPVSGYSKAKIFIDKVAPGTDGAPFPHWVFHDLRRTCASGCARLGIALPVIEKVLNHVSGSFAGVVGTYQRHSFGDEKRHALDAWGSFVERLVADEPGANVVPIKTVGKQ